MRKPLRRCDSDTSKILHYESMLRIQFDRDISFEVGGDLTADIVLLPRLVASLSNEKLSGDSRLISNKSKKLALVERAMHNTGRDTAQAPKTTVSELQKFLNTDK